MHWVDAYPHRVCASVLLLDGKIEAWKIGQNKWVSKGHVTTRWKIDRFDNYEMLTAEWLVNTPEEHNDVFEKLAPQWFKHWPVADDFWGTPPYETRGETLDGNA